MTVSASAMAPPNTPSQMIVRAQVSASMSPYSTSPWPRILGRSADDTLDRRPLRVIEGGDVDTEVELRAVGQPLDMDAEQRRP